MSAQPTPTSARKARIVGLVAVAATAVIVLFLLFGGKSDDKSAGYTVRAIFDSASFVTPGLDVRISGVNVGKVDDVQLTPDNKAAVTFTITRPGFQDLRRDARCTIRPQALIGERFIECAPTEPRPDGATPPPSLRPIPAGQYEGQYYLPVTNTAVPVDADDVLNMNTASVRDRFGVIIRELGAGVAGRGDKIAVVLDKGNEGLRESTRILRQLSEQQELLKSLIDSSDRTLASLAAERASLTGTIENGAIVDQTLARRQSELRASIAALNKLLGEIEPTAATFTQLTDELQPIADDLTSSAPSLASILDDLPENASNATTAIKALEPTVNQGRKVLTSTPTANLITRFNKTAAAVKASGAILGLTLGDLRTTGGLDYFLDAIYGLAYTTNGRDANGNYLRGAVINKLACALPASENANGCGTPLWAETGGLAPANSKSSTSATKSSAAPASASTSASALTSTDGAAANLLFGGKQ